MHQSTACESTAAPPSSASNTYLSIAAKPKRNCNRSVLGAAEEDAERRGGGSDGMDPSQSSTRSRISPMKYVGTLPATKSEAYYPGANP